MQANKIKYNFGIHGVMFSAILFEPLVISNNPERTEHVHGDRSDAFIKDIIIEKTITYIDKPVMDFMVLFMGFVVT
ncbi:hypothetical protein [Eubacterium sp.]